MHHKCKRTTYISAHVPVGRGGVGWDGVGNQCGIKILFHTTNPPPPPLLLSFAGTSQKSNITMSCLGMFTEVLDEPWCTYFICLLDNLARGVGMAEWGHLTVTEKAASTPGIFHQINLSSLHDWINNIGYIGTFLTAITSTAKMNLLGLWCHVMSKVMQEKISWQLAEKYWKANSKVRLMFFAKYPNISHCSMFSISLWHAVGLVSSFQKFTLVVNFVL